VSEGKGFRGYSWNGGKNFTNIIGKAQSHRHAVAIDTGIEIQFSESKDVFKNLLNGYIAKDDTDLQRGWYLATGISLKFGYIA